MKIHKVTLFVYDHENYDNHTIKSTLENTKYINTQVHSLESIEVKNWTDDHPTNRVGIDMVEWFEKNKK